MTVPTWLAAVARALLWIALPVVLLLTPLYLFVTPALVRYEYAQPGIPPSVRFGEAERLRLSDVIVHYLRGQAIQQEMAAMRTEAGDVAMRDAEVSHIVDVRRVMDGFFKAHQVALGVALLCLLGLILSPLRPTLPKAVQAGVWGAGGLILCIVAASLINFDLFFTRFHQLFFTGESWLFYEDDTLIQLYPLPFWSDVVVKLGMVIVAELAFTWLVAWVLARLAFFRKAGK